MDRSSVKRMRECFCYYDLPLDIACLLDVILWVKGPLPAEDKLLLGSWAAWGRADSCALQSAGLRPPLPPIAWADKLFFRLSTSAPNENVTVSSSPAQRTCC